MDLGCNPLPFVLALLLAVNAAFMTPVGAVPNLLVYGPGGYRAIDYLRIGLPVKLAYLSTAIIIICLLYLPLSSSISLYLKGKRSLRNLNYSCKYLDVSGKNTIFASRNLRDGNSVTGIPSQSSL